MARRPNIHQTVQFKIWMDEDLKAKMDLYLFSTALGRIPIGAHQKFIQDLVTKFFTNLEEKHNARL